MAGGGIPTSNPTTTPVASTATGQPLDGSPKFEAVTPVNMDSAPAGTPSTLPAAAPGAAMGTSFAGLPPWLSMFSGATFGTPSNTASSGMKYQPFVPGTSFTGYAGPRAPTIYQPPAPTTTTHTPAQNSQQRYITRPLTQQDYQEYEQYQNAWRDQMLGIPVMGSSGNFTPNAGQMPMSFIKWAELNKGSVM